MLLNQTRVPRRSLALCTLLTVYSGSGACNSEGEGRPDKDLGTLVVAKTQEAPKVDLEELSHSSTALLAALQLPHTWISAQLGAHLVRGSSTVSVSEVKTGEPQLLETLTDTLALDIDADSRYALTLDNSKDYGRHVSFDGSDLYLRPRFGKYHQRVPQSETEAQDIRNEVYAGATDYLELLIGKTDIADEGLKTVDGQSVRQLSLTLAAKATPSARSRLSQHAWRASIEVMQVEGTVSFDPDTGVATALDFSGTIRYQRDKRLFSMSLKASRTISDIGHERDIAPPNAELTMRIPARRRELSEREKLLKSIAPPARKAPTPNAETKKAKP